MQVNIQGHVNFHLKKGALHKELGLNSGKKLSEKFLSKKLSAAKKNDNTILEKRLVFAENAKHFKH